jgi:hypothetical protein
MNRNARHLFKALGQEASQKLESAGIKGAYDLNYIEGYPSKQPYVSAVIFNPKGVKIKPIGTR